MKASRSLSVHLLYCQAGVSAPTKKIDIFCMMMSRSDRQYPMTVVVLSSAKIFQLIGLICWQYTIEGRQPPLRFPSLIISYLREPNRKNIPLAVISRRYYFTRRRDAKYCILLACVSVCLSTCISQKPCPNFAKFSLHVTCCRGSVLLWQQWSMSCTSGFVAVCDLSPLMAANALVVCCRTVEALCTVCFHSAAVDEWICHHKGWRGRSLLSPVALYWLVL